jgi:O-antigen/teichoic acid export membrane protein
VLSVTQDFVTAASESDAITPAVAPMPGLHAGAIIFGGVVSANVANFAFHFISARSLGAASYGDVASLVAVSGIVALPLGAVQVVVARTVAADLAEHRASSADQFARRTLRVSGLAGLACTLALLLASPLVAHELSISSITAVALTAAYVLPSFLTPPLWGLAQGLQRFRTLSASMGAPPLLRVLFVIAFLAFGLGVPGALGATFIAALIGVAIPGWALRHHLLSRSHEPALPEAPPVGRGLAPVILGLLAITSLTTIDVVVAKTALTSHAAGIYASASLVGRLVLYLPAAIVTVLLPKVSSRIAAGQDAAAIVAASIGVTVAFCLCAIAVYATVPSVLASVAFGSGFDDVSSLLPLFGVTMTVYAILNVLLAYHLGKGSDKMSYLLTAGALGQLVAFAFAHGSGHDLLIIDLAVAVILLAVHEWIFEPTLTQSAREIASRIARRHRSPGATDS